jgi:hypothetical protein
LEELLRTQPVGFAFIDLGCGLAGPLCHLARVFPQSQFTGVETAPLSFVLAWLRSLPKKARNNYTRGKRIWRESGALTTRIIGPDEDYAAALDGFRREPTPTPALEGRTY